jgi:hypothetical protein
MDYLYKFHGIPASIITDKDKVLTNLFLKYLFKKMWLIIHNLIDKYNVFINVWDFISNA